LGHVQAPAEERALVQRMNASLQQVLADAFQRRWAKVVVAKYGKSVEMYAQGGLDDPPLSLQAFNAVIQLTEEVDEFCTMVKKSPVALRQAMHGLGQHLLNVRPPSPEHGCLLGAPVDTHSTTRAVTRLLVQFVSDKAHESGLR
jgi:hypothetical protein